MSQAEGYQWVQQISQIFRAIGYWQMVGLALYSYGVVMARQCSPNKVAEKLGMMGKVRSMKRRLERWLGNERLDWQSCCRTWSRFVLSQYVGERLILLVDETKLGQHLNVMVVGLAYRGCCIPLAFWCYRPDEWPMGQVQLIEEMLCWIAEGVPDGVQPLLQAEALRRRSVRGIGTSPALIRVVEALGWHYLFRVQGQTRFQGPDGQSVALRDLVTPSGQWTGRGKVFKKAGWLPAIAHVIWELPYLQAWCLVTNCPTISARLYAQRYWQEASFRDLKSDGWQWQASRIFTPQHANLLVLVLAIAYAFILSLGTLVFVEPCLAVRVKDTAYSLFRHGLRLWDDCLGEIHATLMHFSQAFFVWFDPPSLKTVGL